MQPSTVSSTCASCRGSGGRLADLQRQIVTQIVSHCHSLCHTVTNIVTDCQTHCDLVFPGDAKELQPGKPGCRDEMLVQLRPRICPVWRKSCQVASFDFHANLVKHLCPPRCSKTKQWVEGPTKERPTCTSNFPPPFIM